MSHLPANEEKSLSPKVYALLFLFYFLAMSIGAGDRRALTQHEVFAAEPAREMLHGATWVIQTFAGVPRYEKAPTMSWMIAASFSAFGMGEFQARLPSLLAGGVVVCLVAGFTARMFGRKAGIIAGLLQSTMFYTVIQARLSEADMPMLGVVTAGMLAMGWAWLVPETSAARRYLLGWAFALCAGLACLIKPPAGAAVMYGGAIAFALSDRATRREKLRWVLHPGRLAAFALIGGGWFAAAYLYDPHISQHWKAEASYMAGQNEDKREPFWFYTWNVPMMALPWVLFCTPVVVQGWRSGAWRAPLGKFLLAWMVPGFVILSTVSNKHKHYCLPILPPLTVLAAVGFLAYLRQQYSQPPRYYALVIGAWVAALGAGIGVVMKVVPEHGENIAAVLAVLLVGGAATLGLEAMRRQKAQVAAFFGTAWLFIVGLNWLITPVFDNYNAYRDLAREMAAKVPAGKTTYIVGLGQSQVAFYLNLPLGRMNHVPTSRPAMDVEYVICPAAAAHELEAALGAKPTELLRGGKPGRIPKPEDVLVLLHFDAGR